MIKENRLYGLMAGIAVGFAAWGSVKTVSVPAGSTYTSIYNTNNSNSYIEEKGITEKKRMTGEKETADVLPAVSAENMRCV